MVVGGRSGLDQDRSAAQHEAHVAAVLVVVLVGRVAAANPYARRVRRPGGPPVHAGGPLVCGEEGRLGRGVHRRQGRGGQPRHVGRRPRQAAAERPAGGRIACHCGRQRQKLAENRVVRRQRARGERVERIDPHAARLEVMDRPGRKAAQVRVIQRSAVALERHGEGGVQEGADREHGVVQPLLELALPAVRVQRLQQVADAQLVGLGVPAPPGHQARPHQPFGGQHPLVGDRVSLLHEPGARRAPVIDHAGDLGLQQAHQALAKGGRQGRAAGSAGRRGPGGRQEVKRIGDGPDAGARGEPAAVAIAGVDPRPRSAAAPARPLQRSPRRHLLQLLQGAGQELGRAGQPPGRRHERQLACQRGAGPVIRHGQAEQLAGEPLEAGRAPVQPGPVPADILEAVHPPHQRLLQAPPRRRHDRLAQSARRRQPPSPINALSPARKCIGTHVRLSLLVRVFAVNTAVLPHPRMR